MITRTPLDGLLVVSIEQAVAAPYCTLRLADAGARVIKVEREEGETARHYDKAINGTSTYFAWLNRGKQSCVLDLKSEKGVESIRNMLKQADVFVQNLAPGAAERIGLSHKALRKQNKELICLDIVGYGQDTTYAEMRAYDMLVQAESGLCSVTGTPESPCKIGVSAADIATGMNAHAAILQALYRRSQTGIGDSIEIAMFDCLADWMNVPLMQFEATGKVASRVGMGHAAIHPYGPYPCADGIVVIVVQNPGEWKRLCEQVLLLPELVTDYRFGNNPARLQNRDELNAIISNVLVEITREQAIQRLEKAKLAWSRVCSLEDLNKHPALRKVESETKGERFSVAASPLATHLPCKPIPELGEHTNVILKEFTESQIFE